jgi:hypothetical protein
MKHAGRKRRTAPPTSKGAAPKAAVAAASRGRSAPDRLLVYGCLAATLLFVTVVRYRLLNIPLERDEGEYALLGQLIEKGIPPYAMAYNMKLPGTYYMYALAMSVFGQSVIGIHLGLLSVNLASVLLIFAIGKRLLNETAALYAAASFALLTLSPGAYGFAAHATHFNVLFGLGGLLALLQYAARPAWPRLAVGGVSFGLSFVMKQQAVFYVLFGLLSLGLIERKRTPFRWQHASARLGGFAGALALPYLGVLLAAWWSGTFGTFWHWTVEYAGQYVGITTAGDAWSFLSLYFPRVTGGCWLFWLVGLSGVVAVFVSEGARKHKWVILVFAGCSLASVIPGLYFRPHYFILFFPALALLVAVALNALREELLRRKSPWPIVVPALIFAGMVVHVISTYRAAFFTEDLNTLVAEAYGTANPFQASPEIARFIRDSSNEQDRVAILGSEPQIYFYSRRLPATGYIYTYPLMENQAYSREMQRDMIAEIERNRPRFLVFVNSRFSWTRSPKSANDIFDWYERYRSNYNLVGLVDLNATGEPTYAWRDGVDAQAVIKRNQVGVFERK